MKRTILILAVAIATLTASAEAKLRIYGTIPSDSPTKSLLVYRQGSIPGHDTVVEIPVESGRFDYTFTQPTTDLFFIASAHDVMELGGWTPLKFFAENGEIKLVGENDKLDGNYKEGEEPPTQLIIKTVKAKGKLNNELIKQDQEIARRWDAKNDSLSAIYNSIPREEWYTPEGNAVFAELSRLHALIEAHPDSLPLLEERQRIYLERNQLMSEKKLKSEKVMRIEEQFAEIVVERAVYLVNKAQSRKGDELDIANIHDIVGGYNQLPDTLRARALAVFDRNYAKRFAENPIAQRLAQLSFAYSAIKIGSDYPDFILPDADGRQHSIHNLTKGRLTLIDLWASTCIPCRVNSRWMIPIYNEYKDRGFNIVGIAREYRNLDLFREAVKKDGYPWQQLIELDDSHGIYRLHGVPNALGATFLLSPEGKILKINPKPEEIKQYLEENL